MGNLGEIPAQIPQSYPTPVNFLDRTIPLHCTFSWFYQSEILPLPLQVKETSVLPTMRTGVRIPNLTANYQTLCLWTCSREAKESRFFQWVSYPYMLKALIHKVLRRVHSFAPDINTIVSTVVSFSHKTLSVEEPL